MKYEYEIKNYKIKNRSELFVTSRSEVLAAVVLKVQFSNVTLCRLGKYSWTFGRIIVTLYSKRRELLTKRHSQTFQKISVFPFRPRNNNKKHKKARSIIITRKNKNKKKKNKKNKINNEEKKKDKTKNNHNNNTSNRENKDNCIITVHSGKFRVTAAVSQLLKQTHDAVLQQQLCNTNCHHSDPSRRATKDIQGEYIQT